MDIIRILTPYILKQQVKHGSFSKMDADVNTHEDVNVNMTISRGEKPVNEIDMFEVGKLTVYDEFGQKINVGDLYKKQKTIIILIRHFLCYATKEFIDDLALIPPHYLTAANVRLVVIGCGHHKFISDFKKTTGFQYEMYTDPDLELYTKLQCHENFKHGRSSDSRHVKSGFLLGVLRSAWRGMKHREYQGHLDQQGGTFIMGPGDVLSYQYQDWTPTDHLAINTTLGLAGVEQVNYGNEGRVINL